MSCILNRSMIRGHGIDIEEITSIGRAYEKNERFAEKILTAQELTRFSSLKGKRKLEYLAGRWSAKEAFAKAWGTGIGPVTFQDLEMMIRGLPILASPPLLVRYGYQSAMPEIW